MGQEYSLRQNLVAPKGKVGWVGTNGNIDHSCVPSLCATPACGIDNFPCAIRWICVSTYHTFSAGRNAPADGGRFGGLIVSCFNKGSTTVCKVSLAVECRMSTPILSTWHSDLVWPTRYAANRWKTSCNCFCEVSPMVGVTDSSLVLYDVSESGSIAWRKISLSFRALVKWTLVFESSVV